MTNLESLRRVQWTLRATLAFGVLASLPANVLHAQPNAISRAIAAWPAVALVLAVAVLCRVPSHRRELKVARLGGTAVIAVASGWVSYWHIVDVAIAYGESGLSPYLLPMSVVGLVVVSSVALVEVGGRIAAAEQRTGLREPPDQSHVGRQRKTELEPVAIPAPRQTQKPGRERATAATSPQRHQGDSGAPTESRAASRRSAAETVRLAEALAAEHPGATQSDIARWLGLSDRRLRAARAAVAAEAAPQSTTDEAGDTGTEAQEPPAEAGPAPGGPRSSIDGAVQ